MPPALSDPLSAPSSLSPAPSLKRPLNPPPSILTPTPSSSDANANAPPRQRRPRFTLAPSLSSSGPTPPDRVDSSSVGGPDKKDGEIKTTSTTKPSLGAKAWKILAANGVIQLDWIPGKLNWTSLKPVIRCALAGWIAMLLLLIGPSQRTLGQASFFTLVIAFITPPDKPFVQVLEVHFYSLIFVAASWVWVIIASAICSAVRKNTIPQSEVDQTLVFTGYYLEANVSIVCALFLGVGSGFFCWLKVKTAPSAITFPTVFACIQMDVALTLIPLLPYSYWASGEVFYLPMASQIAVNLLLSLLIFPSSLSASYLTSVQGLLNPLHTSTSALLALFKAGAEGDASLEDWIALGEVITVGRLKSQTEGLGAMMAVESPLKADVSLGRVAPEDLLRLGEKGKDVLLRAGGVAFFFEIIQTALRHTHLDSQAFSVRNHTDERHSFADEDLSTRPNSANASPLGSPTHSQTDLPATNTPHPLVDAEERPPPPPSSSAPASIHHSPLRPSSSSWRKDRFHLLHPSKHGRSRSKERSSLHGAGGSHLSLFDKLKKIQEPVGVFESQRYMDVERSLQHESSDHIHHQLHLLAHSSIPLVEAVNNALQHGSEWAARINKDRSFFSSGKSSRGKAFEEENKKISETLEREIEDYKRTGRLEVLDPYKHFFDPSHPPPDEEQLRKIPHRDLYWCYQMQFTLLAYASAVQALVKEQETIELLRPKKKLWFPKPAFPTGFFTSPNKDEDEQDAGVDDPENIPGLQPRSDSIGGAQAQRRDPDALAPDSPVRFILSRLHRGTSVLSSTQFLFAVKAGILTVLVAIPSWTPSTAQLFYENRGLWALIMAQLTLALYSGETAMAWVGRVMGTFAGCIVGLLVWSIGAGGTGKGTPWGIGAACAVSFPLIMLVRLYYPGPPLTRIIFSVSTVLVIGYGWQNAHGVQYTSGTWGFDVAWRRFLLVLIGISAAWFWSFVPPVSSGKQSLRHSYSKMISTIGDGLCAILSEADEKIEDPEEHLRIEKNLIAMKKKLNQFGLRHHSMSYEISLRGPWPLDRYEALKATLADLTALLSQFQFVLTTLRPGWRRALLKRTRLMDVRFLGDVLAVISLCATCLRSASPLPQITPCPLIERYLERHHGLRIDMDYDESVHHEEESGGVPRHVTAEVLESIEYCNFAVGCATAFAIVGRLDRLMVISKTLLGETFHIDGLRASSLHA
ncbi:hypothetical protein BDY24DRAFT_437656 [Mrakia frigida]|uniref:uncharacterized protein n=1 Tax=Mrakia frigida TaxID=29902 RepID=UPI003FCBF62D